MKKQVRNNVPARVVIDALTIARPLIFSVCSVLSVVGSILNKPQSAQRTQSRRIFTCGRSLREVCSLVLCMMLLMIGILFTVSRAVRADVPDPLDPFDLGAKDQEDVLSDESKSADDLVFDAGILLQQERPLDARTKLLKALQKEPKNLQAHLLLASYYMVHVGHFRLAFKYVKRAQEIFEELHGKPPYNDYVVRTQHARLLYLLSQARLNVDNYQGALDVLDEFSSLGYYDDWYSGTRAWVLMKLGRIEEAIKVARAGYLADSEKGRVLNMLGILLSMSGERDASLEVFRQAIAYELSLGTPDGQPATPLNNSGEVYKEIFLESRAESSWLRATSLPDGCEHVLPSLNLALLYIDELNMQAAKRAIDNFEACVAQYPLRNGEEHRALVHLARGRIDFYSGHIDSAIDHLKASLQDRQWFGKIGTSEKDLKTGALISLAQALKAKSYQLSFRRFDSIGQSIAAVYDRWKDRLAAWWYSRRARQILVEDLNSLEDIYIRNTDSLIEYPTFGEVLADIPSRLLAERVRREKARDNRAEAVPYYDLYLAENGMQHGREAEALNAAGQVLQKSRRQADELLQLRALMIQLQAVTPGSSAYNQLATAIYGVSRATLRNCGFQLPVNYVGDSREIERELRKSAFILTNSETLEYVLRYEYKDGEYNVAFESVSGRVGAIKVRSNSLTEAVNRINDEVFREQLS